MKYGGYELEVISVSQIPAGCSLFTTRVVCKMAIGDFCQSQHDTLRRLTDTGNKKLEGQVAYVKEHSICSVKDVECVLVLRSPIGSLEDESK